ncbi:hypothetical protein [Pseudonocardia alni]|uniref:Uncharacterized protein n=1 Tax=Pseudonocardia alni subsp. carboxydivorans TaxID=415010 RepID=A0ABU9ALT8_PSEA5
MTTPVDAPGTPPYNPFGDRNPDELIDLSTALAAAVWDFKDRTLSAEGDRSGDVRLGEVRELAQRMSEIMSDQAVRRTTAVPSPLPPEVIEAIRRRLYDLLTADTPRSVDDCTLAQWATAAGMLAGSAGGPLGLGAATFIGGIEVYKACVRGR